MNFVHRLKQCCIAALGAMALLMVGALTAAANDRPVRGGKVTATVLELPQSLDPLLGNSAAIDPLTLNLLYDTLVVWGNDGKYEPGLADSWSFSPDGKILTFNLRPGVKFHDGTAFNAAAVVFNLERAISDKVNSPYRANVSTVESIEAASELVVRIKMKSPSGAIIGALTGQPGMMASPAAIQAFGQDFGRKPVGTGPFKFVEWPSGGNVTVGRNATYWRIGVDGQPLPYLDTVTVRAITNSSVKLLELETNNVQLIDNIVPREFARVEKSALMDLVPVEIGVQQWYAVNTTKPPFDNIKLRKAMQYAVNRKQMVDLVAQGRGDILPSMFTKREWAYEADLNPYNYDPAKAKALMAEAGYPNGLDIELTMIQREPDTTVAQIIQSQLATLGVKVRLDVLDRQAFITKNESARHQMSMGISPIPRGDPDVLFTIFFSRDGYARSGKPLLDVASLVEKGRAEFDQAKRKAIYREAQEKMLDDASYGWLFLRQTAYAKRKELRNLKVNPAGYWRLEEVWRTK